MCFKHNIKRRSFLKLLTHSSAALAAGQFLRPIGSNLAFAAGAGNSRKKWLHIDLNGGPSLNIAPGTRGYYIDNFQTIYPTNPLDITSSQALHPNLPAFKTAWDNNELVVLNQVGTPAYSRSHDRAQEILRQALLSPTGGRASGLGARFSDIADASRFSVVSLVGDDFFVRNARSNPPIAIRDLSGLGIDRFRYNRLTSDFMTITHNQNRILSGPAASGSQHEVKGAQAKTELNLGTLAALNGQPTTATFPNTGLGRDLRDASRLFSSGLNVRVCMSRLGGFDTHGGEDTKLPALMNTLNAAIAALRIEGVAEGWWNDLVITVSGEFGRTTKENGSNGTDHGHAAVQFMLGGAVKGGKVVGSTPTAAELNASYYLRNFQINHFNVLLNLFRNHMGVTSIGELFPERIEYRNLDLFR